MCADQRVAAAQHGYTTVSFEVEAPTRGYARQAWDASRSGRDIKYSGSEDDAAWGLEPLAPNELSAVVKLVSALVAVDRAALEAAGAYEHGDPYEWTRGYGRFAAVHLILPPGQPRHWGGHVLAFNPPRSAETSVVVDMWTAEEGPSDLSLECDLTSDDHGHVEARFRDLHVL